ncbi:hypothetical protein HanRHA438_Chr10g0476591 [Helianthus annuus]|nr:hypothetical protein HanRHA438_Chr10g0476591 [Helianthus annuus]
MANLVYMALYGYIKRKKKGILTGSQWDMFQTISNSLNSNLIQIPLTKDSLNTSYLW